MVMTCSLQNKVVLIVTFSFLLLSSYLASAQSHVNLKLLCDSTDSSLSVASQENKIVGAVASIVSGDSVWLLHGYGYQSLDDKRIVDPIRSLFQVGSVGKVFTSSLALKLVESGKLDLFEPVQNNLSEDIIKKLGNQPITTHHLLTHSAGLNDRIIRYAVHKPEDRVPLDLHLAENLPGSYTTPGAEVSYSNYSYALTGHMVQSLIGDGFTDIMEEEIFIPLSMDYSGYDISELDSGFMVTGYRYKDDQKEWEVAPTLIPNPIPAGSLITTALDMSKFQSFLLSCNSGCHGMFTRNFKTHPDLSGYSYGFETWKIGESDIFAKGGMVPGFTSLLIVIPDKDLSIFLSVNSSSDEILDELVMKYWEIIFPGYIQPLNQIKSFPKNDINHFTGSYRLNRLNRESISELFMQLRNTINIWNRGDTLRIYHDNEFHNYVETDPYIFTDVENTNFKIVFQHDENRKIKGFSRDNRIAGSFVPSTYEKIPWYDSNSFLNEWFGFIIIGALCFLIYPFVCLIRLILNKIRSRNIRVFTYSGIIAFLFSFTAFIWIRNFFLYLLKNGEQLLFGFPKELELYTNLPVLMVILLILGLVNTYFLVKNRSMRYLGLVGYIAYYVASTGFLLVLYRWHFIGNVI